MEFEQIKSELAASYQDFRLSTAEKYALVVSFTSIKHDHEKLSYARNYAFEVVSESIRNEEVSAKLALKWLKGVVKSIDQVQQSSGEIKQSAYFSPGKDCERKIIQLINQAQFEIKVCVFTISNDKISKALVKAHKAGVNVRICSDNDKSQDLGSDIELMAKKGIEVRLDQTENHMHHKFAIFDNQTLLNGSYNWTRSASEYNDENIVVSNDSRLIERFNQAFLTLWSKCKTF
ncbi:hypothetical protein FLL45_05955 [Aliikangiella marina]|uniref:phospholipase D n=1 Tax=Aliikangiella marina TaxID=1712262 RepID=A0A545TJT2_9GAMM|nr:phospholipase D-like domain-containing protein [Aliikangiella marina]TQV77484.1 hypothetical protein FLL45_05955 [Aliikangiella marina]